jgi:hypothetical protein
MSKPHGEKLINRDIVKGRDRIREAERLSHKMPFLAVVIGDSLGMPRQQAGVKVNDTYLYLLQTWWCKRYGQAIVWPLIRGGARLQDLVVEFQGYFLPYIGHNKIDVCIVHLGIVDCAPRPLPFLMRSGLSQVHPWLRSKIANFLHRNRQRLSRVGWSFRLTSPNKFNKLYSNFLQLLSLQCGRTYCINMPPALEDTYLHSPGLKDSIVRYNEIINKVASEIDGIKIIDVFSKFQQDPKYYVTQDLHITKEAHNWIYQQITEYEAIVQD